MRHLPSLSTGIVTLLILGLSAAAAGADTIIIDWAGSGDFLTIQAGIDSAVASAIAGDTVLVRKGTYTGSGNRNLDFGGDDNVLLSESGADSTIVDGKGSGRFITFQGGETGASVVDGFTLVNLPDGSPIQITGGASPAIRNCVIRDNDVTSNSGGAVFILASSPTFEDCRFLDNSNSNHGGAIFISGGSPTFTGCVIVGNFADGRGGGVWIHNEAAPIFNTCTITANRANFAGGAFDGGGMILTDTSEVTLVRTIVYGNRGDAGYELVIGPGSEATISCIAIDTLGVVNDGTITDLGSHVYGDPCFCQVGYCTETPGADGNYALATNSPCIPSNSPCGLRIGAEARGCTTVVVWTGGGVTDDWTEPANWSTGSLPGVEAHVQLTNGNVVLDSIAVIQRFTQCSRSGVVDTFHMRNNAFLSLGGDCGSLPKAGDAAATADFEFKESSSSFVGGEGWIDTSEACTYSPLDTIFVLDSAHVCLDSAIISGAGALVIRGAVENCGDDTSVVEADTQSEREESEAPATKKGKTRAGAAGSISVPIGVLRFSGSLENSSAITVSAGAALGIEGQFDNLDSGTVNLEGDIIGAGEIQNSGHLLKGTAGLSAIIPAFSNNRVDLSASVGSLEVSAGTLSVQGGFDNQGDITVGPGGTLHFDGTISNSADGTITLEGDFTGNGSLENHGVLTRTGGGVSTVTPSITNHFDIETGVRGILAADEGMLISTAADNSGIVSIASGASLITSDTFTNQWNGELQGSGTIGLASAGYAGFGSVSPGFSAGALTFSGDFNANPTSDLHIEIGGTTAGTDYDQLDIFGSATFGGALHITLINGYAPSPGDTFEVISVTTVTPAAKNASVPPDFGCFSGTQISSNLYLKPIELPGSVLLVATDTLVGNDPPMALPDTFATNWASTATLTPLRNDNPVDGDPLSIALLSMGSTSGTALLDPGDTTITYLPPTRFVGTDTLKYSVTDCFGGVDSAMVLIQVGDATMIEGEDRIPHAARLYPPAPNPFNPVTRIRFDLPVAGEATVEVFDVRGRRIRVLSDGFHEAGVFAKDWKGLNEAGRAAPSGVYFIRLEAERITETEKVILLR